MHSQNDESLFVNEVYFLGNKTISERQLKKNINLKSTFLFTKTKFDRRILKLDAITIKNRYKTEGFLNATVRDSFLIQNNTVDIYFIVNEGQRIYINNIDIEGNKHISRKKIQKSLALKKNIPFNPVSLNTNLAAVEEKYHHIGKLFSKIDVETDLRDSADIKIVITEGPDVFINKTYIEGLDSSKHYIVNRELHFDKGDKYDIEDVLLSQRRLLETSQFSSANIYPVKYINSDTLVNIVVELRNFPKREISSEGGFVPIEFGGLNLSGPGAFLQWKNRSLFGSTTRLSAKTSLDIPTEEGLRYPRLKIDSNLENQWLMNLHFPTKVQSLYELYKKYGSYDNPFIQRYGFNWSSINQITETSFIEFGMHWEKFSQQEGSVSNVEQRMISLKTKLDFSNHPLTPTNGVIFTGDIYSVGGLLGGTREYQKIDTGIKTYIPLPLKLFLRQEYNTESSSIGKKSMIFMKKSFLKNSIWVVQNHCVDGTHYNFRKKEKEIFI
jgi:outer membrane protein assembly factor BamA